MHAAHILFYTLQLPQAWRCVVVVRISRRRALRRVLLRRSMLWQQVVLR